MMNDDFRRNFLRTAPLAAAFGLALPEVGFTSTGISVGQGASASPDAPLQVFTAAEIEGMVKATQAAPGNKNLVDPTKIPLAVVITTETGKSAAELSGTRGGIIWCR